MNDIYSPYTLEHIQTDEVNDWMQRAGIDAPAYDKAKATCFWQGGKWVLVERVPLKPRVPSLISGAQGKLALIELGMDDAALAHIEAIEDPIDKKKALIEWNRPTWERSNAFLNTTWEAIGGTQEQLDDAFRLADTL